MAIALALMFFLFLLGLIFTCLGVKQKNNQQISFGRTMFTGLLASFIMAVTLSLSYSIFRKVNPEPYQISTNHVISQMKEAVKNEKNSEELIRENLEKIKYKESTFGFLLTSVLMVLFGGMVVSVFIAAMIARRNNVMA